MKSIFQSKTFWIAIGQALIGAFVIFHTAYPDVGWLVVAKSLVDISVRYLTDTAIQ